MMKRVWLAPLALVSALLLSGVPAQAGTYLDETVAALKHAPVFVAEGTENTDSDTASVLAGQLTDNDGVVVAMLPAKAAGEAGSVEGFAKQLDNATGHKYIVAVSIGDQTAAATTILPADAATDLMRRAASVSTSTRETLGTFIRNVHGWQAQNPHKIATKKPEAKKSPQGNGSGGFSLLPVLGGLCAAVAVSVIFALARRRGSTPAEPKVKVGGPNRIRDEFREILGMREQITDSGLRETITQMVEDTNVVFDRLEQNSPNQVESSAKAFETHLQNMLAVLRQYVDVQNNPRYFDDPETALKDGRDAVNGFAEYVLNSARRAGQRQLTEFNVNTKILSAQKYA